jgi:hypothetical protein
MSNDCISASEESVSGEMVSSSSGTWLSLSDASGTTGEAVTKIEVGKLPKMFDKAQSTFLAVLVVVPEGGRTEEVSNDDFDEAAGILSGASNFIALVVSANLKSDPREPRKSVGLLQSDLLLLLNGIQCLLVAKLGGKVPARLPESLSLDD